MNKRQLRRAFTMSLALLLAASGSAAFAANDAIVMSSSVKVYSDSGLSNAVGSLARFNTYTVSEIRGGVAKIRSGSRVGFISTGDIQMIDDLSEEAVVNTNTLVYSSPSRSSESSALRSGLEVSLLAVNGDWALIELDGKIGFVYRGYISKKGEVRQTASVTEQSEQITYEEFDAAVCVDSLDVYKQDTVSSKKLGTLKFGTQVRVTAYNTGWAYITYQGKKGFVNKAGLNCNTAAAQTTVAAETPVPAASASGMTYDSFTATVCVSALTAYQEADAGAKALGKLSYGTQVTVEAYDSEWAYVNYQGNKGFMQRSGLVKNTAAATAEPMTECDYPAVVSVEALQVFKGADGASRQLGTLNAGEQLTVKAIGTSWAYIDYKGHTGYVLLNGLTRAETAAPTVEPTPVPTQEPASSYLNSDKTNKDKIFQFLTSEMGFNTAAACGILANIQYESGFKTDIWNSSHISYGLCQWTYSRLTRLQNFCAEHGYDESTLEGQLYYLKYELENHYTKTLKYLLNVENSSAGAYDAGYYWCYHFEVPANRGSMSVKRGNLATNTYWPKYS